MEGIDGIRYCFHKKDYVDAINKAKTIVDKGYDLYIQPMITLRYSDDDFRTLISLINSSLPSAKGIYIVDSFGEMREEELFHLFEIANKELKKEMSIGFHSHNNLQLSYSNVISLLKKDYNRNILIDSSIMGMGKGAGNLNTELLLEHLNRYYGSNYEINSLLDVIDKVIKPIHSENYWGYSVEYFLSSKYHCTPSYASHFYNKHMLSISDVSNLLAMIDEDKRISFDKKYAENLYKLYNTRKDVDDEETLQLIKSKIDGKKVLIIAPGKSILGKAKIISDLINSNEFVSFSLNMKDAFNTSFNMITRGELINDDVTSIHSSILLNRTNSLVNVLSYKKWIAIDGDSIFDSSSVMLINVLVALGVKDFYLCGFDGFTNVNSENYYKDDLRNSIDNNQAKIRNYFYKSYFSNLKRRANVTFVTPSIYED